MVLQMISERGETVESVPLLAGADALLPYPWQIEIADKWAKYLTEDRVPPSILLVGKSGSGRVPLAKFFAKSALCEKRTQGGCYCGQCSSCRLFDGKNHPDFYLAEAEPTGGLLTVDWAREFNLFWQRTASRGGFRVAVIEQAQRLNLAAANALLKTIEELPERCCAIFIVEEAAQLPATLRSRCVQFKQRLLDSAAVYDWLRKQGVERLASFTTERLNLLQRMFPASPLLILERLKDDQFWSVREELFKQLASLNLNSDFYEIAKQLLEKQSWVEIARFGQSLVQDLFKIKLTLNGYVLHVDYQKLMEEWANHCTMEALMEIEKWLREATGEQQKFNINGELLIETLLYRWFKLISL